MTDPKRLLDGGGDLEVALLRSARSDAPSPQARQKALAAAGLVVGATAATAKAAAAGGAAAKFGSWAVAAWVGIGVLGGVAAVGVVESVSNRSPVANPPAVVTVQAPAPPKAPVVLPETPRESSEPAAPSTSSAVEAPRPVQPVATNSSANLSLAAEVASLDRARKALSTGNSSAAFAELSDYQRQFPRGAMGPEATVLRIEAMSAAGDRSGARSLAERFLAAHPASPHGSRIRSLVGLPSIP